VVPRTCVIQCNTPVQLDSMDSKTTPILRALTVVDGTSEEVVEIIEFQSFDLALFTEQFDVPVQYDPEMLDRYAVGPDDAAFVISALSVEVTTDLSFDFTRYAYFIEAYSRDS
jgi:hypothetical protein